MKAEKRLGAGLPEAVWAPLSIDSVTRDSDWIGPDTHKRSYDLVLNRHRIYISSDCVKGGGVFGTETHANSLTNFEKIICRVAQTWFIQHHFHLMFRRLPLNRCPEARPEGTKDHESFQLTSFVIPCCNYAAVAYSMVCNPFIW